MIPAHFSSMFQWHIPPTSPNLSGRIRLRSQAGPRAVRGASRHQQRQRCGVSAAAGCQPAGEGSMGLGWAGLMEDFHGFSTMGILTNHD